MPFGILDTQFIDLPEGIDESYLRGLETRSGMSFERLVTEINSRLEAFNSGVDPLLASLLTTTDQIYKEEVFATPFIVEEKGEYTVSRPQFAEGGKAIPIPIRGHELSTEWTEDGIETMSMSNILLQVDSILLGLRRKHRRDVLRRLFSDAEVAVDAKSTAVSPGFAGSGTGTNVFDRPLPSGEALPGNYTHYFTTATANAAGRAAAVKAARNNIKRWYNGPYEVLGSHTFIEALVSDPDNFVPVGSPLIRLPIGATEALVDANTYLGVFDKDIRVRHPVDDFPGDYGIVYKYFGVFDPQNALAWRFDPLYGRQAYLRSRSMYPLDQSIVLQRYGIGVNNRVGAAVVQAGVAGGAYAPPVIGA